MDSSISTRKSKRIWLICLLLLAAVLAVYWQAADFDFIHLDDNEYVTQNSHIKAGLTSASVSWAFTAVQHGTWQPLVWLSYLLDYEIGGGLRASVFHSTNILLHMFNTILLFIVLERMTRCRWRCALVAALFAVHPMHVESVAWVAERKDVLSTFFLMLSLLAYHRYTLLPSVKRYIPVLVLFILGLMSKPMLVTMPFILIMLDWWPLERLGKVGWRRLILEKAPFFTLSIASSVVAVIAQNEGGALGSLQTYPFGARLSNAVVSYAAYILKAFWPARLSVFYPHPGNTLPIWQVLGSALALICLTVLALRVRKGHPYLLVGWLWYAGTLVPVSGLVQIGSHAMADRFTYVPLIGLFIAAAWGLPGLLEHMKVQNNRKTAFASALATAVLLPLITCSYVQASYWRNSILLLEHAVAVTKGNYLAHNNLGAALREKGKLKEAEEHYREALRINPNDETAHTNLGSMLANRGEVDQAEEHLRAALRADNKFAQAHYNLANLLLAKRQVGEAVAHYEEAIRCNPNLAEPHYNLGNILAGTNPYEAADHYREALRIKPEHVKSRINLGTLLYSMGETQEAADQFRTVLKLDPKALQAHFNLGVILAQNGDTDEAISHFRQALQLDPKNGQIHYFLSQTLRAKGDHAGAAREAGLSKRLGYQP